MFFHYKQLALLFIVLMFHCCFFGRCINKAARARDHRQRAGTVPDGAERSRASTGSKGGQFWPGKTPNMVAL